MQAVKNILKRYFVDALGAMALGLFSSLIIGLILSQIGDIPGLGMLKQIGAVLQSGYVVGAAIGGAVAWGLKVKPLAMFSAVAVGAVGYVCGGPVGAFVSAVVGAEVGNILAGKTKLDILLTPLLTVVPGGIVGILIGPYLQRFMSGLGQFVMTATELHPIWMGMIIAVLVGMALTAPISSAALCVMINLNGIAAGAACVGCCCQMIGFAVASYRDNGIGGSLSQAFGTSMLQFHNIVRRPTVWLAPILASAVLGPISTAVLKMTNTASGAGMGTSGLVGQFGAFDAMSGGDPAWMVIVQIVVMHFVLPAVLVLFFDQVFRKLGWVRNGDMRIYEAK